MLDNAHIKFYRADQFLGEVRNIIEAWSKNIEDNITIRDDGKGLINKREAISRSIFTRLALAVGDFVQNSRSSLDYIVCELSTKSNKKGLQFSITDNEIEDFEKRKKTELKGLEVKYIKYIYSLQESIWLKQLRDLSNEAKHRNLNIVEDNKTHRYRRRASEDGRFLDIHGPYHIDIEGFGSFDIIIGTKQVPLLQALADIQFGIAKILEDFKIIAGHLASNQTVGGENP